MPQNVIFGSQVECVGFVQSKAFIFFTTTEF